MSRFGRDAVNVQAHGKAVARRRSRELLGRVQERDATIKELKADLAVEVVCRKSSGELCHVLQDAMIKYKDRTEKAEAVAEAAGVYIDWQCDCGHPMDCSKGPACFEGPDCKLRPLWLAVAKYRDKPGDTK